MKILSIDSATESASCAILEENRLLGEINFNYKKQHSVILMTMVEHLLKNLALNIGDIDGFVISKGPGSFTGLRIGIATVKGLSAGTGKPFLGVSSLDALAYNMAFTTGIICPILDALRGNVYTALYKFQGATLERITDYLVISLEELITLLKEHESPYTFIGDAVHIYKNTLIEALPNVQFAPVHLNLVRASALGELGLTFLALGQQDDINSFAPLYLRKSQAEREYEKKVGLLANE
ncbi:MAG: tRNA (adenosine(37)-N6)-threonylcarbamoyltransferase complex dimerization subunit type 1 TsaB [Clostridiaceae bacterium]|nr:tRNA (adenosine(37)-N6)-threonylcarbamoyltransferase complex dimerization subunit type 1 TsaB [Clostridiaceae bacterium]